MHMDIQPNKDFGGAIAGRDDEKKKTRIYWALQESNPTSHRRSLDVEYLLLLLLLKTMVEQLNRSLNLAGLSRDGDQAFVGSRSRRSRYAGRSSGSCGARFHDLDVAPADAPDLVDLGPSFPDNASDEVVGDVDLLRLRRALGRTPRIRSICGCTIGCCSVGCSTVRGC